MRTLLLAPHSDDETLFAAYTCIEHQPQVVIVLGDPDPDMRRTREVESERALACLGCKRPDLWWSQTEGAADAEWIERRLRYEKEGADLGGHGFDAVFAPAVEDGGHEEHNLVGRIALDVFGDLVTAYTTYTRTGGRTHGSREVEATQRMISAKLRALAEYGSQIAHPARRPWFYDLIDLREFYA